MQPLMGILRVDKGRSRSRPDMIPCRKGRHAAVTPNSTQNVMLHDSHLASEQCLLHVRVLELTNRVMSALVLGPSVCRRQKAAHVADFGPDRHACQ
jgi:hypothetical protein